MIRYLAYWPEVTPDYDPSDPIGTPFAVVHLLSGLGKPYAIRVGMSHEQVGSLP
jgi:hypothetical protein